MVKSLAGRYIPEQGDIVWITLDPTTGHEQKGRRPAVVLSARGYNSVTGLAIVCPVTSITKGYPFEVSLKEEAITGVVLADQVKSVDWKARKATFLGRASKATVAAIKERVQALIE